MLDIKPFQETLGAGMCAPATLKMLLTYYNLPGNEKTDIELSESFENYSISLGITNQEFMNVCKTFGLNCIEKVNAEFSDVSAALQRKNPVVVDWFSPGRVDRGLGEMADGHYSIVIGIDDQYIYLQDPEVGEVRKILKENFYRVWFDFDEPGKDHMIDSKGIILRYMIEVEKK